jgi:hypothetical protein
MKKSKKGITLVELVICCAILVLLGGAVTAVLMSGEHVFSSSANSANAQMEFDVLQTNLMGIVPSAKNISVSSKNDDDFAFPTTGYSLYSDGSQLIIRSSVEIKENGLMSISTKETELSGVVSFSYKITPAGVIPQGTMDDGTDASATATARPLFSYTVTFNDGSTYNGGFVISNIPYISVNSAWHTGSFIVSSESYNGTVISFSVPEQPVVTE